MTDWPWPNFTPEEMASKDGTPFPLTPESIDFMNKLQTMRTALNFALSCNSCFRSPYDNQRVDGAEDSPHLLAIAGDLAVYGEKAFKLVAAAPGFGFTGIGVKQDGPTPYEKRFIHLDTKTGSLRPRVWSY